MLLGNRKLESKITYMWSLCCCQVTQSCLTLCNPWTAVHQASLSFTISQSLFQLIQCSIELVKTSNLCCPFFLLPSIFPCIRVFFFFSQQIGFSHQVIKVLELQLQHQPSNEYSGLLSFRIDQFDLLAVQGTLKSLLHHDNLIASILDTQPFLWFMCIHIWLLEKQYFDPTDFCILKSRDISMCRCRSVRAFVLRSN